jgi:hypothetical protein
VQQQNLPWWQVHSPAEVCDHLTVPWMSPISILLFLSQIEKLKEVKKEVHSQKPTVGLLLSVWRAKYLQREQSYVAVPCNSGCQTLASWVHSQVTWRENCCGHSGHGAELLLSFFAFTLLIIILPLPECLSLSALLRCVIAVCCYILIFWVEASSLTWNFAGCRAKKLLR